MGKRFAVLTSLYLLFSCSNLGTATNSAPQNSESTSSVGENQQIQNGDFHQGKAGWDLWTQDSAKASFIVLEDTATIGIQSTGEKPWSILFTQQNLRFEKGKVYQVCFSGESSSPIRIRIQAGMGKEDHPGERLRGLLGADEGQRQGRAAQQHDHEGEADQQALVDRDGARRAASGQLPSPCPLPRGESERAGRFTRRPVTRSVLAGSKTPWRARAQSTRQAPRVASSQ